MGCYGCGNKNSKLPEDQFNPDRQYKTCSHKLEVCNWLEDLPHAGPRPDKEYAEVRFKNGRKEFFININKLALEEGDAVAVEAAPGHDIGIVSLVGDLVYSQMQIKKYRPSEDSDKKIYRKAKAGDVEKWKKYTALEEDTKLKSKAIISRLKLKMKLTDVEYQGDGTKAIFYYSADDRVDFRELIKFLADEFKIRVEMRQIGVRQEASRLGGVGSCGRELCCSGWLTNFKSVSTSSARTQQLSLNPQKLAGQCAKLKCCLNYEQDVYLDALSRFPDHNVVLKTKKGNAFHRKSEIFKEVLYYSYDNDPDNWIELPLKQVKKIIDMNKRNKYPSDLGFGKEKEKVKSGRQMEFGGNSSEDLRSLEEGNY